MLTNEMNELSGDEVDERIKTKYKTICDKLNIEENVVESTWEIYQSVRNDHSLKVSSMVLATLLFRFCILKTFSSFLFFQQTGRSNTLVVLCALCVNYGKFRCFFGASIDKTATFVQYKIIRISKENGTMD